MHPNNTPAAIARVPLTALRASDQPRPLNTTAVDEMADSIRAVGLIQPITVRRMGSGFQIVAGHHRAAAVRALGWPEIDARVIEASDQQAALIEIDENLRRSELTYSESVLCIKRRAEIVAAMQQEKTKAEASDAGEMGGNSVSTHLATDALGRKKSPQQAKAFSAETAAITGESKQVINQKLAVGKALGKEALQRVHGTSLDKKLELMTLATLPEPERKDLIERAAAGEKVTARSHIKEALKQSEAKALAETAETNRFIQRMGVENGWNHAANHLKSAIDAALLAKKHQPCPASMATKIRAHLQELERLMQAQP